MTRLVHIILRGSFRWPLLGALVLILISVGLRFEFAQEALPYVRMARQPLPAAIAISSYRVPDTSAPREAVLDVQVMTGDQVELAAAPDGSVDGGTYFLPFTAPPGGADEGKIYGGMILTKQARDAFVQWSVTKAHPRLANYGIELTVAGLVERPGEAAESLRRMRAFGLQVADRPVFLTPYSGRRIAVLEARARWVSDNPLQRMFLIAGALLMLIALNRFAHERKLKRSEPEPLSLSKARNTAFERLNQLRVWAGSDPEAEEAAAQIVADAFPAAAGADMPPGRGERLRGLWHVARLWGLVAVLGWVAGELFPALLGADALIAGVLIVPCWLLLQALFRVLRAAIRGREARFPAGAVMARAEEPVPVLARRRWHRRVTAAKLHAGAGGRP